MLALILVANKADEVGREEKQCLVSQDLTLSDIGKNPSIGSGKSFGSADRGCWAYVGKALAGKSLGKPSGPPFSSVGLLPRLTDHPG